MGETISLLQSIPPCPALPTAHHPLTFTSWAVTMCHTLTIPRSQLLTMWVSLILVAKMGSLCLNVFRHFPVCMSHSEKQRQRGGGEVGREGEEGGFQWSSTPHCRS